MTLNPDRYLLYKNYESGFNNQLMSLELAVGLAYLTKRKLVFYGSEEKTKRLKPIPCVYYAKRKSIVNNHKIPNIFELLDELPVELVDYIQFNEALETQKMTIHHNELKLVNAVFVADNTSINPQSLSEFADGRQIFQDVDAEVLHISQCNLGYYSRFFYSLTPSLYAVMEAIHPQKYYRDLTAEISRQLNNFNGIHIRLTDFRNFLPQKYHVDPEKILEIIKTIIPTEDLLVICTDESENKEFFSKITSEYKNYLFLDELIVNEFSSQFKTLPFTDEVTLGLICNLVMSHSQIFAGTPGSSFTGMIHRNWLKKQLNKNRDKFNLDFKYIASGFDDTEVVFKNGSYLETKPGLFSWNRVNLPLHTETKSWYREWVESVILPHTATTKPKNFPVTLPVSLFQIWEKGKHIQQKIVKVNKKNVTNDKKDNENELILCCSRTSIDTEATEQINRLVRENIDWMYLTQTAVSHGVLPLLYRSLNATFPEAVPKVILTQLRDYFHANALRNMFLTKELFKLLSLFKANDIPAIPFKGPVLAALAYDNLALRQFSDLDILVHKQDFHKAKELLITQEYQHICTFQRIYSTEQEVAHFQQAHLSGEGGRVGVDLHYEITPKDFFLSLDVEMMWERLEPVSLVGTTVLTFSPEDLLLILCLNGTKEYWRSLERICDIAALINADQELDWERLIEQASSQGIEGTLFIALFLANTLMGTALPDSVWQRIQAIPGFISPVWQVREWLFNVIHSPSQVINFYLFNMLLIKSPRDKIRYLIYLISPNLSDRLMLPLPPSLWCFYHPIRLLRLAGKYLIKPVYMGLLKLFF